MKRTDCARLTRLMVPRLLKLMGWDRWRIEVVIGPCSSEEAMAEITVNAPYSRADLTVDSRKIPCRKELLEVLAHEVTHISLHQLELFSDTLTQATGEDHAVGRVLAHALNAAIEVSVCSLERPMVKLYELEYGEVS